VPWEEGGEECALATTMPPFPRADKKTPALKRSLLNTLNASYQNRTAEKKMWSTAHTCPLFLKKATKKPYKMANGRMSPKFRGNRALSTHTIKAMASGAGANASALIEEEAAVMRCDSSAEISKYPLLPSVTRSAAYVLEAACIAYAQTIFGTATELRRTFSKSKPGSPDERVAKHLKVSVKAMQAGADSVNKRIADATGFMPPVVNTSLKPEKKAKKAKGEAEAPAQP